MTTLDEFLQEYPVIPIRLYRPDPRDWFKDVMLYLNRLNDCRRRVEDLRSRAEILDVVDDPDEDLIAYRDEVHQKLADAEQDMRRVRVEVMEVISLLECEAQRTVVTRRYVEWQSWDKIAWAMDQPVETVQMHHAKALPVLKRLLVARGLIPDTYMPKKRKRDDQH
jgi:DNA-directed RNA polymerase specialized sigma24 family protein